MNDNRAASRATAGRYTERSINHPPGRAPPAGVGWQNGSRFGYKSNFRHHLPVMTRSATGGVRGWMGPHWGPRGNEHDVTPVRDDDSIRARSRWSAAFASSSPSAPQKRRTAAKAFHFVGSPPPPPGIPVSPPVPEARKVIAIFHTDNPLTNPANNPPVHGVERGGRGGFRGGARSYIFRNGAVFGVVAEAPAAPPAAPVHRKWFINKSIC